jgi:hypothetical protein
MNVGEAASRVEKPVYHYLECSCVTVRIMHVIGNSALHFYSE